MDFEFLLEVEIDKPNKRENRIEKYKNIENNNKKIILNQDELKQERIEKQKIKTQKRKQRKKENKKQEYIKMKEEGLFKNKLDKAIHDLNIQINSMNSKYKIF